MDTINFLLFFFGLLLLIISTNYVVVNTIKIAEVTNIPKIIIGATILSLVTILPEFLVSINATMDGEFDLAIGNILGSGIFNIGVILSIIAIFSSGKVDRRNIFEKTIIFLISLLIFTYFVKDYSIVWFEGAILFLLVFVYALLNARSVKKQKIVTLKKEEKHLIRNLLFDLGMFIIGSVGVFISCNLIIASIFNISNQYDIKEQTLISLLAIGTSLPELAIIIISIIKKQQSLAIGNILGANIMNMTMVMGLSGVIAQGSLSINKESLFPFINQIPQTLWIDLPVLFILFFLFLIPIIKTSLIKKWQGIVGFVIYIIYFIYLLINN